MDKNIQLSLVMLPEVVPALALAGKQITQTRCALNTNYALTSPPKPRGSSSLCFTSRAELIMIESLHPVTQRVFLMAVCRLPVSWL